MRSKAGPVNSYTFDLHDGFTGSHGNLADHLSAAKDLGKADEPLSARSGPGRKVDRGTATPEETPAELRAKGWNRPAASVRGGGGGDDDDDDGECPAGMYAASGLHHPAQRMGLETPRFKAVDACARCPTGRFGSGKGLRGLADCVLCPAGRYGARPGGASVAEGCALCAAGRFGSQRGLEHRGCSGACPPGKHSLLPGLTSAAQCLACPRGYRGPGCESGSHDEGGPAPMTDQRLGGDSGGSYYGVAKVDRHHRNGHDTRMRSIEDRERAWDTATHFEDARRVY
jgi:hypothetical protein